MVYADKRLSFTVGDANALRITKQPQNVSGKATNTLKLSVEAAGGNISAASKRLGISRNTI